jgi:aminoglycoside phosphotransferase family enzyme
MQVGDQADATAFLRRLASEGEDVEVVSTHASMIFLAGARAFKRKRAVRYSYLDFSTPEKRLACCRAELELNRRTAPHLYLAVRAITREADGNLRFDGAGQLVDTVVEMRRFGRKPCSTPWPGQAP